MQINECKSILKTIDLAYSTHYAEDKDALEDWFKDLKDYESDDVCNKLTEHMKSNFSNVAPKKFYLLKGLLTIEGKKEFSKIRQECRKCNKFIPLPEFDAHFQRCSMISFIERNVKEFLNQEIDREQYYKMSDEELYRKHNQISKIVLEKSDNEYLKSIIRRYLNEE